MRLALAQINSVVGDIDGNAARSSTGSAGRASRTPISSSFPSSSSPATRPRTCCSGPASSAPRAARSTRSPQPTHGITVLVGAPHLDDGPLQRVLRARPRRGARRLQEVVPPELRRLRRGPLLRRRARPACCCASATSLVGADDLRGRLAAGPARDRSRARRRAARREHLRVAVPRRQGPRARGDAEACGRPTTRASSRSATRSAARTS